MISEFVLENFLEKNLDLIEPGLRLLERQFKINNFGKIDLLCEDKNNTLIIIELKTYADYSTIDQIKWYKKAIFFKFPGNKARFILICLSQNERIPHLCKINNIEFLQLKDKRIPIYTDFLDFSWKEKEIISHFLSNTCFNNIDPLFLSDLYDMTVEEVERIIAKINKKTSLNIKSASLKFTQSKKYSLEL